MESDKIITFVAIFFILALIFGEKIIVGIKVKYICNCTFYKVFTLLNRCCPEYPLSHTCEVEEMLTKIVKHIQQDISLWWGKGDFHSGFSNTIIKMKKEDYLLFEIYTYLESLCSNPEMCEEFQIVKDSKKEIWKQNGQEVGYFYRLTQNGIIISQIIYAIASYVQSESYKSIRFTNKNLSGMRSQIEYGKMYFYKY